MQSPAQVAVQEWGSPAQSRGILRAAQASAPMPWAVGPDWAGTVAGHRGCRAPCPAPNTSQAVWLTQPRASPSEAPRTPTAHQDTSPDSNLEDQDGTEDQAWGGQHSPTGHGPGFHPHSQPLPCWMLILAPWGHVLGHLLGHMKLPHVEVLYRGPQPGWRRNWSRGSNRWLEVPHSAPAAPHRSHFQRG